MTLNYDLEASWKPKIWAGNQVTGLPGIRYTYNNIRASDYAFLRADTLLLDSSPDHYADLVDYEDLDVRRQGGVLTGIVRS